MSDSYAEQVAIHRKTRRAKLMRAAAAAFLETGLKQTTMDQVAGYCGISKIVLYRYFGSKDNLIHAILEEIVDQLLEADQQAVKWWSDLVPLTLKIARENKDAMTLLVRQAAHDPKYGSHFKRLHDVLVERSQQRQLAIFTDAAHSNNTKPVSVQFLAETTMALFFDSYVRWLESGTEENDAEFIDWIVRSVRAMGYYWAGENPPE
jgi:AcrR family transcriptional regulator